MKKLSVFRTVLTAFIALFLCTALLGSTAAAALAQDEPPAEGDPQIEVISPYYSEEHLTTPEGEQITGSIINGPSQPLPEFEAERQASMTEVEPEGTIANFPSYKWVFGCSAVSGAMISAYYDRNGYPNMYTGPTSGGLMPLTDTAWPTWSDGYETYPNNPLIASHKNVDGRTTRGSIDDYWVKYGSSANDPYITGGWTQHTWGTAIGDYMKTSQSAYGNTDGSTTFYTWTSKPDKLTCADMVTNNIHTTDGTYGRKLFYEARGYTVTDCFNQKTDNNSGGFTLANFKAEIDAGHPVLLNLAGHSIVGYGYNGSTIYIRDTWDNDTGHIYTMTWGGSYGGMALQSVSVVRMVPAVTYTRYLPILWNAVVPPPANPFQNPGFELGRTVWTEYSSHGWALIYPAAGTPVAAHDGSWLAWLGGASSETARLSQTITISGAAPYLHFWYYIASEDVCGFDFFRVKVNGSQVYSADLCSSANTNGWVKAVVNLSGMVGASKTVMFEVTTDGSLNSNLFLDDVSMSNLSTMMEEEPVPAEYYPGSALLPK
ncbi:MAG TPA: hypothetical protein PK137_00665 [Anaerolineaceae bacterium]|nr:hypothetical protein [Anaerolineaceae bacterium]HOR84013.1 hypothetical protein [Anaerolineaceae bacterium]HPL42349.1 hypothetical protein [Anaerolineaceae bacterium]